MSVLLKNYEDVNKLGLKICREINTSVGETHWEITLKETKMYKSLTEYGPKVSTGEFVRRALWYSWVANKVAYEVQYRENLTIDYDKDHTDIYNDDMSDEEAYNVVGSLRYNIYTNAGNCFLQDDWVEVLDLIYKYFKMVDEYKDKPLDSYGELVK